MSSAWVVPALLGPVVAGALAQHASWRWAFLGLVPFVVVGALLMVPVLRGFAGPAASASRAAGPKRILHALAVAVGVAALEAAGQHPSAVSVLAALLGAVALVWGLRTLLPPGTARVRRGVAAPIAMRGLLAGSLFGVESMVPLTMSVQHGFGAIAAGLPLVVSGLLWSGGSWWQGRDHADDGPDRRVRLIRAGFGFVATGAALTALVAHPDVPGWLIFPAWGLAGLGAGLSMSSLGVLMLRYTTDADRGGGATALRHGVERANDRSGRRAGRRRGAWRPRLRGGVHGARSGDGGGGGDRHCRGRPGPRSGFGRPDRYMRCARPKADQTSCRAIISPIGIAAVAAGDGALQTCSVRGVSANRKSCTSVPSRSTACARMPAGSGSRSSRVSSGQYLWHSRR